MKTEGMKELYATGEWIMLFKHSNGEWEIKEQPEYMSDLTEYKLIHIKHKEVLDHVLNGGEVSRPWSLWDTSKFDANIFFETYSKSNVYEIIPTKQDLNGHYCLATKEHYEQLVKDGCIIGTGFNNFTNSKYLEVLYTSHIKDEAAIYPTDFPDGTSTPMHYHNNQWVFGSLEHGEELRDRANCTACKGTGVNHGVQMKPNKWSSENCTFCEAKNTKPPKRITLEEYLMSILKDISETAALPSSYTEGFTDCISYIEGYKND